MRRTDWTEAFSGKGHKHRCVRYTTRKSERMRRVLHRLLPVFRTFIGLGLLVYLGVSGTIDWSALSGLARNWPLSLGSLCLVFGATVAGAWRLCLLLRPHGLRLALRPVLKLTLIGLPGLLCYLFAKKHAVAPQLMTPSP